MPSVTTYLKYRKEFDASDSSRLVTSPSWLMSRGCAVTASYLWLTKRNIRARRLPSFVPSDSVRSP